MEEREQLAQLWEKVLYYIENNGIENYPGLCTLLNRINKYNHICYKDIIILKNDLKQCNASHPLYERYKMTGNSFYWSNGNTMIRKWFIQERIKDLRGICTQGTL